MVDFGSHYIGPTFFPDGETRRDWIPVHLVTATWYIPSRTPDQYDEHTHTIIPLRLAWAWTVWKTQGQTVVGKVSFSQGRVEGEHGLMYVAISRATKFSDIGLHKKMKHVIYSMIAVLSIDDSKWYNNY
eukprot:15366630-Ditylum_brightwellii.AAC.1